MKCSPPDGSQAAFSLLEILVSALIFVLLVVLTAQLVGSTSSIISGNRDRIDSDAASRAALRIVHQDFTKRLQRPQDDVDYLFLKIQATENVPGNDKLFFFSEAPGYLAPQVTSRKSTVSLIGYRINQQYQLERLGKALPLSGSSCLLFLDFSNSCPANRIEERWETTIGSAPDYNGEDTDYYVLSEGIFRLEFCFMKKGGGYFQPGQNWKSWGDDNQDGIPNLHDLNGIILAVASLDSTTRQTTSLSTLNKLAWALPDSTVSSSPESPTLDSSQLMAALWKQELEGPNFASKAQVPPAAVKAVRISQFFVPLN